jgi:hypothetical protein
MLKELNSIGTLTAIHAFALTAGLVSVRRKPKPVPNEIVLEVTEGVDGLFRARSLSGGVFTEADSWEGLRANVRMEMRAVFLDHAEAIRVRLHIVHQETIAL